MKKIRVFNFAVLLFGLMVLRLPSVNAQHDYLAYGPDTRTELFNDSFDNNSFQWITDNLWISGKIEAGAYNIKCKDYQFSTGLSFKPIVIPAGSDYEIEATIKVIKGTGALVFGMTNKYDHYRVEISDNNSFEIIKDTPSKKKLEKLYTGTNVSQLTNGFNKLTIRCVYNTYYVFANEYLVSQLIAIKPEGDGIGFNVGLESEISVDYLKISKLGNLTVPLIAVNNAASNVPPVPPVVTWISPSDQKTTQGTTASTLKAVIKSSVALKSLILYQNGSEAGRFDAIPVPGEAGSYTFEKAVTLKTGENSLHLIAENSGGTTTSDLRYFTVLPSPPQITWSAPVAFNTMLTTPRSNISATIRSDDNIRSVTLFVNGVPDNNINLVPSSGGNYTLEKTLDFVPGETKLYLVASNSGGSTTSDTRSFTNQPSVETIQPVAQGIPAANTGPVITWTSPSGARTQLDTYNATVKATISSGSGLKSVMLYMNGVSKGEADVKLMPDETALFQVEKNLNFGPGENSIYLVATNSEGATKSEIRYFTNPFAVAPVIAWSNPATSNTIVNTESMTLNACIKSQSDLRSVKLLVNGSIQMEDNVFQPSAAGDCNYNWQNSVILREGDNSIFIIATNTAGSTTSEKRVIKLEAALKEKRLALVFGNSEYKNGVPLKNPVNDANLMEGTLKELGFDVIKRLNVGKVEMESAIREFTEKLPQYNVALFYYAGHGNQVDGKNYLVPVDANLAKPSDCMFEAVKVDFIVEQFEKYQDNTNIVILDACRNNPYASWARGGDAGFRQITFSSGTIIAYATSEGATAADGLGANGLFTEELVKQMIVPQSILSVFMNTRANVKKLSSGAQIPMEWNKLNGDFFFKK